MNSIAKLQAVFESFQLSLRDAVCNHCKRGTMRVVYRFPSEWYDDPRCATQDVTIGCKRCAAELLVRISSKSYCYFGDLLAMSE